MLDGDLDVVVLKALEKDRDRRYESPKDLATDVSRFLADQPVLAVPPSSWYLARKYFQRHRAAILTAAAVALLLLAAAASARGKRIGQHNSEKNRISPSRKRSQQRTSQWAQNLKRKKTAEQRLRELYVADMQLAAQIWNRPDGNQRQIEELLAAWIPVDGQPDIREFTWRHQWSLLHQSAKHTFANTTSATFAENGSLVTAGSDGISFWNEAGKLAARPYDDDASDVVLSNDGRWAVKRNRQLIQLVDLSSGKTLHEIPGERFSLATNSRFLACWKSDGEITVWDIQANPPSPLRLCDQLISQHCLATGNYCWLRWKIIPATRTSDDFLSKEYRIRFLRRSIQADVLGQRRHGWELGLVP